MTTVSFLVLSLNDNAVNLDTCPLKTPWPHEQTTCVDADGGDRQDNTHFWHHSRAATANAHLPIRKRRQRQTLKLLCSFSDALSSCTLLNQFSGLQPDPAIVIQPCPSSRFAFCVYTNRTRKIAPFYPARLVKLAWVAIAQRH